MNRVYVAGYLSSAERQVTFEDASFAVQRLGFPYYEINLDTGMNIMEVLTDIYRDVRSREKSSRRAHKCNEVKMELQGIYSKDMIFAHIVVAFAWVIFMCQFLSIYQLIVFKAFSSVVFTEAQKVGIYILCIIGYILAWFVIALLYVSFVRCFRGYMVKKVLIGIGGVFAGLFILGGLGVVIWRLIESAD